MPEENVEVVRRMYQASHGGNAEDALAFYDPNVVVDASVRMDGGIGRGRDELAQIVSGWTDAFDAWSDDIEEMRDLGDTVLVVSTQRGIAKRSGVEVHARYALLYEVRRETITRLTMFADVAEALKAAGLSE